MSEIEKLKQHTEELIELLEPFEGQYINDETIIKVIQTFIDFFKKHQIEINLEISMYVNLLLTGWQGATIRKMLNNITN